MKTKRTLAVACVFLMVGSMVVVIGGGTVAAQDGGCSESDNEISVERKSDNLHPHYENEVEEDAGGFVTECNTGDSKPEMRDDTHLPTWEDKCGVEDRKNTVEGPEDHNKFVGNCDTGSLS